MHIMFGGNFPEVILKGCKTIFVLFLLFKQGKQWSGNSKICIAFNNNVKFISPTSSIQMIAFHILPFDQPMLWIQF